MSAHDVGRRPVDWAELRRRVERTGLAAAGGATPDTAQQRRVLEERARALARPAQASPRGDTLALVCIGLGGETWGLDARLVWDVFRVAEFSPLPGATPPVAGVTAWRGSVLTALDLRAVLGIPVSELADLSFAIVIGEQRPACAVLAHAAGELVPVDARDVREPPEGVALQREYVLGVTPASVLVLDLPRVLRHYR